MHGFIKRFADGVFYPEEVEILVAAFDDAWAKLQASGAPFVGEGYVLGARKFSRGASSWRLREGNVIPAN